jgi:hypothetical protein
MIKHKLGVIEKKEVQQQLPEKASEPIAAPEPLHEEAVLKPKAAKKRELKPLVAEGAFFDSVMAFFASSSILVVEQNALKKSDFEFVIKFVAPVGEVKYYCAANGKKRITADDLSAAFARAQMRNLPVFFLTSGTLSKDAEALVAKGLNITVKKI